MPVLQSLVLTDRQATPVNRTLLPSGKPGDGIGQVSVPDVTGAITSEIRFSAGTRRSGSRVRSTLKLRVPVMVNQTINGITSPVVARESFVDCVFNFSVDATEAEKNDVVGMFYSSLATGKTLVHDTVVKSQGVWS